MKYLFLFLLLFSATMTFAEEDAQLPYDFPEVLPIEPQFASTWELVNQEGFCLSEVQPGMNVDQFTQTVITYLAQRNFPVSQSAAVSAGMIFAGYDVNSDGLLDFDETLRAKGGKSNGCGATCGQKDGKPTELETCPVGCHCHRNEGGRCAKDGT